MIDEGMIKAGDFDDEVVEKKIQHAQILVGGYTGRVFEAVSFSEKRNGGDRKYRFVNPFVTVSVSYDYQGITNEISSSEYEVVDRRYPAHSSDEFSICFYLDTCFGKSNLLFEGTVGYLENNETPSLIRYLTGRLATYMLKPGLAEGNMLRRVQSEKADIHTITYKSNVDVITGDEELDEIIKLYRRHPGLNMRVALA
jgi:hypothetical protein